MTRWLLPNERAAVPIASLELTIASHGSAFLYVKVRSDPRGDRQDLFVVAFPRHGDQRDALILL